MADILFMNKAEFPCLAPALFDLMADNMQTIAPPEGPREAEYRRWRRAVGEGLQAEARKIILLRQQGTDRLIGFLQYYTNETTFMIEELQIAPDYQGTAGLLKKLFGFVLETVRPEPRYVEAFVHKTNARSLALQRKLGMEVVGTALEDTLYHLRGDYAAFAGWYREKKRN